jgi:predicted nucleic acid-binding protein
LTAYVDTSVLVAALTRETPTARVHFRLAALAKFHRLTTALEIVPVRREHFRTAARFADHYSLGLREGDSLHCPWRPIEVQR